MRIKSIKKLNYQEPVPVYDVVGAEPYNNFLIQINSGYVVSHNC